MQTLVPAFLAAHIMAMWKREQWRRFVDHPVTEWGIFVVGILLMVVSPLAGVVPGPGGIFIFAIGLALVLKTSMWAKRRYVHFKRWQPKAGRWADWGLRRGSAKRREAVRRDRASPGAGMAGPARPGPLAPDPARQPDGTDREEPDRR